MKSIPKPEPGDYSTSASIYVDRVINRDVYHLLRRNAYAIPAMLIDLSDEQWHSRYAPDKWSIAEVVMHMMDSEQVFCYRALRIARGDQTPLPGFDQEVFAQHVDVSNRDKDSMIDEYHTTRMATMALLNGLDQEVASRRGKASNAEVTVAALFYMIAGHEDHHRHILKERYLSFSRDRPDQ